MDYVKRLRETGVNNPLPWEVAREAADYIAALEAKLATAASEALAEAQANLATVLKELKEAEEKQGFCFACGEALGDAQPASAEVKSVPDGWQKAVDELEYARECLFRVTGSAFMGGESEVNSGRLLCAELVRDANNAIALSMELLGMEGAAPTPPQQPRQESEIAAEALEEAAEKLDKWDAQARIVAKWLRERATMKGKK